MSDPNQFLVDYESIRRRYERIGVLGNGKDSVLDHYNTLTVVNDKHSAKRRVQQIFNNVNGEFLQKKLLQIHDNMFTFFTPDTFPVLYYGLRNSGEKLQDLIIIYDFPENYKSLEEVFRTKKEKKEKMDVKLVEEIVRVVIENVFMGGRLSGEFIDVNMQNIFVDEAAGKVRISNFGVQISKRFDQKIFNNSDKLYQPGFNRQNNIDAFIRSGLFSLGFMCYLFLSNDNSNNYYNLDNQLKLENLQKQVQKLKKSVEPNLFKIMEGLIQREENRLSIYEIVKSNVLQKDYEYYQGNNEGDCKQYSGFMKDKKYVNIGDITKENDEQYKGGFKDGSYDGYGVLRLDGVISKGMFSSGSISEGILVEKDQFVYIGQIAGNKANGKGVKLNLLINQECNFYFQEGEFKDNELQSGKTFYQDNVLEEGYDKDRVIVGKKINNLVKYKQVQSYKLANMDTIQLQKASIEVRKKHYKKQAVNVQNNQNMLYSNLNQNNNKQFRGEGLLYIHVVGSRNLQLINREQSSNVNSQIFQQTQQKEDQNGNQVQQQIDSYVKIEFSQGVFRQIWSKIIEDNENPIYHLRENIKIKTSRDQIKSQDIIFKVINSSNDQIIGQNTLPLQDMYFKGGIWINKFVDLFIQSNKEKKQTGQINLQMQWRPFDLLNVDKKEPLSLLDQQSFQKQLLEKQSKQQKVNIEGTGDLIVNIVNAQHLRPTDYMGITDSYVVGNVQHNGEDIYHFHTHWVESTNDPKWEFHRKFRLHNIKHETPRNVDKRDTKKIGKQSIVGKPQDSKIESGKDNSKELEQQNTYYSNTNYKLKLEVYDYQIECNELLGQCEVSLDGLLDKPNTWLNQIMSLNDKENQNIRANIYVQVCFRKMIQSSNIHDKNELVQPPRLR